MSGKRRILFVPGYFDLESRIMMERLFKASDLWWQGSTRSYDWLIVSGGITRPEQTVSEAASMKDWFMMHERVDAEKIIVEGLSRDSFESVRNVVEKYLRDPRCSAENAVVTIVSQWEHAVRLKMTFQAYGIRTRIVSVPGYSLFHRMLEWGYILYTLFDPKGRSWYSRRKIGRKMKALPQA